MTRALKMSELARCVTDAGRVVRKAVDGRQYSTELQAVMLREILRQLLDYAYEDDL